MISDEERRKRPPSEPPELLLIGEAGEQSFAAKISAANWLDLTPGIHIPVPEDLVEWPKPVARGGRTTIEFQSEARPFWFDVAIATEVDPNTGWPVDPETGKEFTRVHDFKYRVGGQEDAPMRYIDGIMSIDCLPPETYPEEFVVIFAAWSVYPDENEPIPENGIGTGQVYGNWIFHFVNE